MGVITEENYLVHYYDVDSSKKLSVASMVNYFQDIAIIQSERLKRGVKYLHENKIAWVLYKWKFSVHRLPDMFESVKVRTWPYQFRKTTGFRRFEIIDENGTVCVEADSVWFLIGSETRKPAKIPDDLSSVFEVDEQAVNTSDFAKLTPPQSPDYRFEYKVRDSDMDTNQHVNNVRYIEWAMEPLERNWLKDRNLKHLEVHYVNECFTGDTIRSGTKIISGEHMETVNHIVEKNDGTSLALLRSSWQ